MKEGIQIQFDETLQTEFYIPESPKIPDVIHSPKKEPKGLRMNYAIRTEHT